MRGTSVVKLGAKLRKFLRSCLPIRVSWCPGTEVSSIHVRFCLRLPNIALIKRSFNSRSCSRLPEIH